MKLVYNGRKDHTELRRLLKALVSTQKGEILSGMSARVKFNQVYGIDVDHHEYAYLFDQMSRTGETEYYNHNGGDTQYRIL